MAVPVGMVPFIDVADHVSPRTRTRP